MNVVQPLYILPNGNNARGYTLNSSQPWAMDSGQMQSNQLYVLTPVTIIPSNMVSAHQSSASQLAVPELSGLMRLTQPPPAPVQNHKPSTQTIASASQGPSASQDNGKILDVTKYKTRMCRNWMQTQYCPYGNVCMYAHGEHELRNVTENSAVVQSLYKLAQQQLTTKNGTELLNHPSHQGKKKRKSRAKRRNAPSSEANTSSHGDSTASLGPIEDILESDDGIISDEMLINMVKELNLTS